MQAEVNKKGKSTLEGASGGDFSGNTTPPGDRRRRRKVKHEPLQDADEGTKVLNTGIRNGVILVTDV